jgi:uncharacterized protein (PEP-CTERM system associated)
VQASRVGACSVFTALALSAPAQAVNWRFTPSVGSTVTFSDNVNQSANNEETGGSLSLTPGFTLQSLGSRRVQANVGYNMSAVTRFGGNSDSDFYHNLNSGVKAEVVEDFLFFDGAANISQQLISLLGSPADTEINDANRATVGTYSISPYVQKRLGTFAVAQARYTASGAIFGDNVASNSNSNGFSAGLSSGSRFNDLSWGLSYSLREASNRNSTDSTFESVTLSLGYALSRKFRLIGTVGVDNNDYISTTGTDGASYSLGFGWTPNRRTSIEMTAGERYFGNTLNLSARYRTQATNWNLTYVEDVSDLNSFVPTSGTVFDYICQAADGTVRVYQAYPFTTPPENNCVAFNGTPGQLFDLRNGVFISKSLRGGMTWNLKRMAYSLTLTDTKRLYTATNAQDETSTLGFSVSYRMTPATTLSGNLLFSNVMIPASLTAATERDDDLASLSVGLSHRFADTLNGALTFRHTQRDSNAVNSDYDENSLSASVNMRF